MLGWSAGRHNTNFRVVSSGLHTATKAITIRRPSDPGEKQFFINELWNFDPLLEYGAYQIWDLDA